jgi:L-fucose mutarotase
MLIGLNPLLSPKLLQHLRTMGHGDEIVVVDANFPADSSTTRLVRLDGIPATDALRAILTVMPLDSYVDDAAISMENAAEPDTQPKIVAEFQNIINEIADAPQDIVPEERFAFYERARGAYAIVQTGETRHFGNLILKKGVLPSAAN